MAKPDKKEFDKAVKIACHVLKVSSDPTNASRLFIGYGFDGPEGDEYRNNLVNSAKTDRITFDTLCAQVADNLRDGEPVPQIILEFASNVLERKITRPRGVRQQDYEYKSSLISAISAVERNVKLHLTRNDESIHKMSVLDAVSIAVEKTFRKNISYNTLKRDYYKSARIQIELDNWTNFNW